MTYYFDPKKHKPQGIILSLNTICNLNCKMCQINKHMKSVKCTMIPRDIYSVLSQFRSYNPEGNVQFDSGEIFANRKMVYPFLKYCIQIGLKIGIVTNGTLITEKDLEVLKDTIDYLVISFDSTEPHINDFIRGKDTYKKVIRLFNLLNSMQIPYSVNTVISTLNIGHITNIYRFLIKSRFFIRHDLNILTKSFFAPRKQKNTFYESYSFKNGSKKENAVACLEEYLGITHSYKTSYTPLVHESTQEILNAYNNDLLKEPVCNVFTRKLFIDFKGHVRLCPVSAFPALANIADKDFNLKRVWESQKAQLLRVEMNRCLRLCGKELCNNKKFQFNNI